MINKFTVFIILTWTFIEPSFAQPWMSSPYMVSSDAPDNWKRTNFYEIEKAFHEYEKDYENSHPVINLFVDRNSEEEENAVPGRLQFERWKYYIEPRVFPSGDITLPASTWKNFKEYLINQKLNKKVSVTASNWTMIGPASIVNAARDGRVNFVRHDPSNNNLWMGVAHGGLWKSTDNGQTWSTNTDTLEEIICSDLAIDPTNSNIMYLATGDKEHSQPKCIGILKTTDGGLTWLPTGFTSQPQYSSYVSRILIDPTNPNNVLAATSVSILKSTNGFTSYSSVSLPNSQFSDMKYKPGDPTIVFAANNYGKFFKSTDSGSSWTQITTGLPTSNAKVLIGVSQANPAYVYLLRSDIYFEGLYKSTDTGNSFSLVADTPNIIGSQGHFATAIIVNPTNADELFVGGLVLWHSTNGGVSWAQNATYISQGHVDIHDIQYLPGNNTFLVCSDGGLNKTTDGGGTWSVLSEGLGITAVYNISCSSTDPGMIVEGSQDNGSKLLKNGVWTLNQFPGDCMEVIIDYSDPNTIYGEAQFGALVKSIDGGQSSSPITTTNGTGINAWGNWVTPYIMHPTDHNTLLVGKAQVYKTIDGGANWNQLGSMTGSFNVTALAYAPSNPDYLYVGNNDKFFVSTNGTTLIDRSAGLPPSLIITSIAVKNSDPAKCWITSSSYTATDKVFYTSDAGLTWTNYSSGLPNLPANTIVHQAGSQDLLYLGMDVGVYYRDSTMNSWQLLNTGLPNVIISELEIQYTAGKLRAATYGRSVWESDLYAPVSVGEISNVKYLNVYPNPAHNHLEIESNIFSISTVIQITNMIGQVVYSGLLTEKNTKIELKESSGLYFISVTSGDRKIVKKLIIE